eukprot:3605609-Rhodomonas_salina.2
MKTRHLQSRHRPTSALPRRRWQPAADAESTCNGRTPPQETSPSSCSSPVPRSPEARPPSTQAVSVGHRSALARQQSRTCAAGLREGVGSSEKLNPLPDMKSSPGSGSACVSVG